ncbi:hypothetical protein ACFOLF_12360 [Paenibacillus sepulcri]|uniref:Uncharacterized protein n=1 Tax=Paenibacillus sepulcri TaxID=359917 RepID=A0ABS7BYY8_9BACL|nr:hypothetical protein [Paenibacillus sepulcri]
MPNSTPLDFLYEDPRPEFKSDSHRWRLLFRLIPAHIADRDIAETLSKRLWTLRAAGALMRRDFNGIKFVPTPAPVGIWEGLAEYKEVREKYLTPYAEQIRLLIGMIDD